MADLATTYRVISRDTAIPTLLESFLVGLVAAVVLGGGLSLILGTALPALCAGIFLGPIIWWTGRNLVREVRYYRSLRSDS